ncbi:MAG: hypothetical protein U0T33_03335 [Bacteroidales bacterium]
MRLSSYLLLFILIWHMHGLDDNVYSQAHYQDTFRLVFYNAENFFDTSDDSITDDNAFLPGGDMHWSRSRYDKKLNSVYRVITAAGGWEPPALIAFCEVENHRVLADLISFTYLSKFRFGIVTGETNDRRGIRNGIIYRKDLIRIISVKSIIPEQIGENEFSGRLILYASMLMAGDTVDLFLNHWTSRRAGVLAGEAQRQSLADAIIREIDSLGSGGHYHRIIIAGDFNCTPGDPEILSLMRGGKSFRSKSRLVNLAAPLAGRGEGTYRYRGTWEMLDQVIVSEDTEGSSKQWNLIASRLIVFRPSFLLYNDPSYPGLSPFPTYSGRKYLGGYSDHLPLIFDLVKVRAYPRN